MEDVKKKYVKMKDVNQKDVKMKPKPMTLTKILIAPCVYICCSFFLTINEIILCTELISLIHNIL